MWTILIQCGIYHRGYVTMILLASFPIRYDWHVTNVAMLYPRYEFKAQWTGTLGRDRVLHIHLAHDKYFTQIGMISWEVICWCAIIPLSKYSCAHLDQNSRSWSEIQTVCLPDVFWHSSISSRVHCLSRTLSVTRPATYRHCVDIKPRLRQSLNWQSWRYSREIVPALDARRRGQRIVFC